MSTRRHAVEFATRAGWASRVPVATRDALLAASRHRRLPAKTRVTWPADEPGPAFFIAEGCLAAETASSVTLPRTYIFLYPGTWIADGAVWPTDHVVRFFATRPSALLLVDNADLRRIATAQVDLWRHIARLSVENHYRSIGLAQELMIRGGRRRLAALLVRLSGLREEVVPHPLVIDATQTEVAEVANLARSVVSSFLKQMERDGILRLGWSNIEILAPDRLLRFAEEV
jgi:CRP-like cAMP-binding protein